MGRAATSRRALLHLAPVAGSGWAAAAVAILAPDAAAAIAAALWSTALAACALLLGRHRSWRAAHPSVAGTLQRTRVRRWRPGGADVRRVLVVIVLATAASAAVASHVASAEPAREALRELAVGGGRAIEVRAEVIGKVERRADGSLAFDARVFTLSRGDEDHAVRGEAVVRVAPEDLQAGDGLDVGALVDAAGTASPPRTGERAVFVLWASRGVEVARAPAGAAAVAAGLRQNLLGAVAGLPGNGAALVPGLAVGDTSLVTAGLDAAMKKSSLSHLTAVSGANCALVVGIAFTAAALVGASRVQRVIAGLTALAGFVLLVTPEPSVVRAAAMAAIAMLAVLLGRTGAGIALLSLAVTVLLVADPWLAASLGFALSVAATASLLLVARPLAAGLARAMPRPLALALAVPVAAQLACGPLLVLIEPAVPLYGVVANLLAGPAAPVTTVLGLAACLSAPLAWLQSGLAALAWVPASWIAATATTLSDLPAARLPWWEGLPGAVALTVVGTAVGAVIALPRRGRRTRLARALAGTLVATAAGVAIGAAALTSIAGRWTLPSEWTVLACDVGQGDALLLRSADAVALIDTGPDPEPLVACLSRTGIEHIDLLVLTHFDLDHVGGLAAVQGRVGTVLHGPADAEGAAAIDALRTRGASVAPAAAGMTGALGAARWRVLWPPAASRAFPEGNDASVVLDVRGGGIPPILLLGDLSASPQRALAASGSLAPPYGIVKVAHHGSADQDAAFYAALQPAIALVTVGSDNDYGHPRQEILDTLQQTGARVARTDRDGAIALWWTSERTVAVWRDRGG